MASLNLFPARVAFVNSDGTLTAEAYRALNALYGRVGGAIGDNGVDVFSDVSSIGGGQSSLDNSAEVRQQEEQKVVFFDVSQPAQYDNFYPDIHQPMVDKSGAPVTAVTVTASPFSYTADRDGYLVVTGGTVTLQEYGRNATFTNVGLLNSMLPILLGDIIRVTYTAAPTITFIPR